MIQICLQVLVQQREEERVQMQNQLTLLQEQINSYRAQLPTSTTVTTTTIAATSDTDLTPASTPTHTELHISEHIDVSMHSSQLSPDTSQSNSRPVSFISVTSETSDNFDGEVTGLEEELGGTLRQSMTGGFLNKRDK